MKFSRFIRYVPRTLPRFLRKRAKISDPAREVDQQAYLRLFQLKRAHRLMWAQVDGDDTVYQTVILHVDTQEPFLLIDEPFPNDGVFDGMVGAYVTLTFNEEGMPHCMRCKLLGKASNKNSAVYQLAYPEVMRANQRRESFRLPVQASDRMCLSGESLAQMSDTFEPVVLDISSTGMRWALLGNVQEDLHAGKVLTELALGVMGCERFPVSIDITHSQWVPGEHRDAELGYTVIGGRFLDISPGTARQLDRYITLAQRKQQREKRQGSLLAA